MENFQEQGMREKSSGPRVPVFLLLIKRVLYFATVFQVLAYVSRDQA